MKPERRALIASHGKPGEIDEYEKLLSARFARDPSIPMSEDERELEKERNARLQELGAKLFTERRPKARPLKTR